MQIIYTSLHTDNHTSTSPLSFYRPDALSATQPTASKHWRQLLPTKRRSLIITEQRSIFKTIQVVKAIQHKNASPPHTDDSIVFPRWRQCARHVVHPSQHPHYTGSASLLGHFKYIDCRKCWGMSWASHFSRSKLPLRVGIWIPI